MFCRTAALAASLFLVGCGAGGEKELYDGPTGTVSGKVTHNGKALSEGSTVQGLHEKGYLIHAKVGADGAYKMVFQENDTESVPVGKYQISVGIPAAETPDPEDADKTVAPKSVIPEKYLEPTSSGLSLEVKEGENKHDVTLK